MKKFDTKVQHLKYKVLREVSRLAWEGRMNYETLSNIPKVITPGKIPTMRCCVYKERAILAERVDLAMSGCIDNTNVIRVIDIACDDCPAGGYFVTDSCRGCLAHRCDDVCPKGAITFDKLRATIDKDKCVNCGKCAEVCPYSAITNRKRPCENACKIKAISTSEDGSAKIDDSKCISCGACVYQCPFGAISDRSFILNTITILKKSNDNTSYQTYAVVAPSISSQFSYAKLGQVVAAIKKLGFAHVVEAALGADMVAMSESKELAEKGMLTSSCCPAFVDYVKKSYPKMAENISHSLSPMATISKFIKEKDPTAKVVFIGPCTAKKMEFQKEEVRPYVDAVITFEELQALFDSRDFDISQFEEETLDTASYYGRIFARCGGLADAVAEGLTELGIKDFELKPVSCNGIEECRIALVKATHGKSDRNFIEGMACIGGCVGGAGCLTHAEKNRLVVDKYSQEASKKQISQAVAELKQEQ